MDQLLQHIIHSRLMSSIGRSLGACLWYGVVSVLTAALILVSTRFLTSSRRYNLLLILFSGFSLAAILPIAYSSTLQNIRLFRLQNKIFGDNIYLDRTAGFFQRCADFLSGDSGLFGLIWILVAAVLFARGLLRYAGLRRFRAISSANPIAEWRGEVAALSARLRLKKIPAIYASDRIEVPILIGHSDPAIFLPRGMPEKLSRSETEVIILHELAHAARRDYLTNLFQSVFEMLFWFNPAVWWISGLLKAERENCCDDLVLKCTDKPVDYIRSLIKFEEFRLSRFEAAMTLTGRNGGTFRRINRIVSGRNSGLDNRSALAVAGLVVVAAFCFVSTGSYAPKPTGDRLSWKMEMESAAKHRAEAADLLHNHP